MGGINQPRNSRGEAIIFKNIVRKRMRAENKKDLIIDGGFCHGISG